MAGAAPHTHTHTKGDTNEAQNPLISSHADVHGRGTSCRMRLSSTKNTSPITKDAPRGTLTFAAGDDFKMLDESAHYEFVCKQAGIKVAYCAEDFENDGSLNAKRRTHERSCTRPLICINGSVWFPTDRWHMKAPEKPTRIRKRQTPMRPARTSLRKFIEMLRNQFH
jgi:hypothetical protein